MSAAQLLLLSADVAQTKRCSRCRIVKPWSKFYLRTRNKKTRPIPFCRKCAVKRVLKWKRDNPEAYAAHKRERVYIRQAAKVQQLGKPDRCAICGLRGWLCNGCNRALGWFGDNPAILRAAITYLNKHGHLLMRPRIS